MKNGQVMKNLKRDLESDGSTFGHLDRGSIKEHLNTAKKWLAVIAREVFSSPYPEDVCDIMDEVVSTMINQMVSGHRGNDAFDWNQALPRCESKEEAKERSGPFLGGETRSILARTHH